MAKRKRQLSIDPMSDDALIGNARLALFGDSLAAQDWENAPLFAYQVTKDALGASVRVTQLVEGAVVLDGTSVVVFDRRGAVIRSESRWKAIPGFNISAEAIPRPKARLVVLSRDDPRPCWIVEPEQPGNDVALLDAWTGQQIDHWPSVWQAEQSCGTYVSADCRLLPGDIAYSDTEEHIDDEIAEFAHNVLRDVWAYYASRFNWRGYDGKGQEMTQTCHCGVPGVFGCSQSNAAFIPSMSHVVFGDGDGEEFDPLCLANDIVAHEHQHGITYWAIRWDDGQPRGLDYRDQSGALNEGYSDLMSALVVDPDAQMGEDVYTPREPGDCVRDIGCPANTGNPDHMCRYVDTGSQGWKVHHNSTIASHAGWLMWQGGAQYGVEVPGIGADDTAAIWFRALKMYLVGSSDFAHARAAMVQACADLFPGDAWHMASVVNGWAAVGVGQAIDVPEPPPEPEPPEPEPEPPEPEPEPPEPEPEPTWPNWELIGAILAAAVGLLLVLSRCAGG